MQNVARLAQGGLEQDLSAPITAPVLQQDVVAALQGQWFAAGLHLGHWGFPGVNKTS